MSVDALTLPHGLSLVTIADCEPPSWASLFAAARPAHVPYRGDTVADRNLLGVKLDAAVTASDRAVLLVAEGAGCFAAAWWARLSPAPYVARVAGALFFRPVGSEGAGVDDLLERFASPRTALPFPSLLLDAEAGVDLSPQVRELALGWGSGLDQAVGMVTDTPLRRTRRVVERFTRAVIQRDVRLAERIIGRSIGDAPDR